MGEVWDTRCSVEMMRTKSFWYAILNARLASPVLDQSALKIVRMAGLHVVVFCVLLRESHAEQRFCLLPCKFQH